MRNKPRDIKKSYALRHIPAGIAIAIAIVISISSCTEKKRQGRYLSQDEIDDRLVEINKEFLANEEKAIKVYLEDKEWQTDSTGTGLRIHKYQEGKGELAMAGQTALIHFTVTLLSGKECYTSREGEPRTFKIGGSDVETGLHEGITYMRPGDKAHLIMPSHLAHGLSGDGQEIPPKSTIVYDVELIALK